VDASGSALPTKLCGSGEHPYTETFHPYAYFGGSAVPDPFAVAAPIPIPISITKASTCS